MSSAMPLTGTSNFIATLGIIFTMNFGFAIAVFVVLTLPGPGQQKLENIGGCDAGIGVVRRMRLFEVVSLSFFLFSSLVAQALSVAIKLRNTKEVGEAFRNGISSLVLRIGTVVSTVGSATGFIFLMLSIVCSIEIQIGVLWCWGKLAIGAVATMLMLVCSGLAVYISTVMYSSVVVPL